MKDKKIKIKSKVLFLTGILLVILVSFNRCRKDDYLPSSASIAVIPADKGSIALSSATDLKWSVPSGDKFNVYFGEKSEPELYKSGYTSTTLNVPVSGGHTYYWKIGTISSNGTETAGPVYSFKVKVLLDLDKFTGIFDCNEPKYSHYEVKATKIAKDTLEIDNFWDLSWKLKYVFDDLGNVRIIPKTFSPDPKLAFMVSGSGNFNNETNEFSVNYSITQKVSGDSTKVAENLHTYARK